MLISNQVKNLIWKNSIKKPRWAGVLVTYYLFSPVCRNVSGFFKLLEDFVSADFSAGIILIQMSVTVTSIH